MKNVLFELCLCVTMGINMMSKHQGFCRISVKQEKTFSMFLQREKNLHCGEVLNDLVAFYTCLRKYCKISVET